MAQYISDDEDEDDDLRRAIALSLQESEQASAPASGSKPRLIAAQSIQAISLISDDEEDEEDDDLEAPIRHSYWPTKVEDPKNPKDLISSINASKHNSKDGQQTAIPTQPMATGAEFVIPVPQPKVLGIVGLDRKKMEEERLARLAGKRKAPVSPPPLRRDSDCTLPSLSPSKDAVEMEGPQSKKQRVWNFNPPVRDEHKRKVFAVPSSLLKSPALRIAQVDASPSGVSGQSFDSISPPVISNIQNPNPFNTTPRARGNLISKQLSRLEPESSSSIPDRNSSVSKSGPRTSTLKISNNPEVMSYSQQQSALKSGLQFPNGVVKKTWAYGYPRRDDIKIEEVLQKNDLELAVLSAFQWDDEWIMSKLDVRKTNIICVVQATTEVEKETMRKNVPPNIKFCFPSMAGQINCMHSKLMLLSHPTYIRIVVPSANLVPYDWGESGGVMENTVFIIDLPRLPDDKRLEPSQLTPFARELAHFLNAQGMDSKVIGSLSRFDFSKTTGYAFVHTIGGAHTKDDWKRTGYCGLGSAIKELGLATDDAVEADFVSASIGSLNHDFINSLYLAAKGDDGMAEYDLRNNKPSKARGSTAPPIIGKAERLLWEEIEEHFRIYFPTHESVAKSKGGTGSGGTICLQKEYFDNPGFPQKLFRDCQSVRTGMLMHNKMLFVRFKKGVLCSRLDSTNQDSEGSSVSNMRTKVVGWAYVGSANLSQSAWGKLVKDRTTKSPKLNCRNWECGVVIPATIPTTEPLLPAMSETQATTSQISNQELNLASAKTKTAFSTLMNRKEATTSSSHLENENEDVSNKTPSKYEKERLAEIENIYGKPIDFSAPFTDRERRKLKEIEKNFGMTTEELSDLASRVKGFASGEMVKDLREDKKKKQKVGMDIFEGFVPVPMIVPGEEYNGKKPWFFMQR